MDDFLRITLFAILEILMEHFLGDIRLKSNIEI